MDFRGNLNWGRLKKCWTWTDKSAIHSMTMSINNMRICKTCVMGLNQTSCKRWKSTGTNTFQSLTKVKKSEHVVKKLSLKSWKKILITSLDCYNRSKKRLNTKPLRELKIKMRHQTIWRLNLCIWLTSTSLRRNWRSSEKNEWWFKFKKDLWLWTISLKAPKNKTSYLYHTSKLCYKSRTKNLRKW